MASDLEDAFVHVTASIDGASSDDAAVQLARRFAIGSLMLTVMVAIASAVMCARCPAGHVSHVVSTGDLHG